MVDLGVIGIFVACMGFIEVFLLLLIPSALPYVFGRMVGDQKQAYTVAGVMGALWLVSTALTGWAVATAQGTATAAAGGLGEGFESPFGAAPSAIISRITEKVVGELAEWSA